MAARCSIRLLLLLLGGCRTNSWPRPQGAAWLMPGTGAPIHLAGRFWHAARRPTQANMHLGLYRTVTCVPILRAPFPRSVRWVSVVRQKVLGGSERRGRGERAASLADRQGDVDLFSHILLNKAIMAAAKSGSLSELCNLVEHRWPDFNPVNAATAYKWLLLMRSSRGAREQPLNLKSAFLILESALLKQHVKALGARECANVLHAMAKTKRRLPSPQLLSALARRVEEIVPQLSSQGVANTLWAVASLRTKQRVVGGSGRGGAGPSSALPGEQPCVGRQPEWVGVVDALMQRAQSILWDFKPQEVANLFWALAQMGRRPGPGLVGALEQRVEALGVCLNSQDVANILWAYATLGIRPGESVAVVLEASLVEKVQVLKSSLYSVCIL